MPLLSPSPLPSRLDVACDWSDKELIKQIPGVHWDTGRKMWHVPQTIAAFIQLGHVFNGRMSATEDVLTWANTKSVDVSQARAWRSVIDPGVEIPGLYPWQVADYYWLAAAGSGLLGNDQGTGKTISILTALRGLPETLPALVVCPNSVKRVWEQEAAKWFPEAHVYVVGGSAAKRQKTIKSALADPMALIVINYESLRSHSRLAPYGSIRLKRCEACGGEDPKVRPAQCHAHPKELNGTDVLRTVVLDEAQALKDAKSQQTRACWAVCHDPSVTRRIAMTGTPIANHVGDLWSIMHAIAPDEYPVRSAFLDRYCQMAWNAFGGMDIVGIRQDHAEEFFSFFDARYRRVTKIQAAPWLPSKYRSVRYAPLPIKMRKAYDELDEQLVTRFDDGTIAFAPNTLAQTTRLLQVSSAYGTTEADGSYRMVEPSPKIDVLMEILEETEGRQIVACALSKQLINLAASRLGKAMIPFGLITGDVHELDRRRSLDDFQNGRLRVLLFTIGAGGVGLTMTAADTIVFLQRSWSLIQNLQAEDRCLAAGTPILTPNGWKPVEEITVGDMVVTHQGRVRSVTDTWSSAKRRMMADILISGWDDPISTTADHLFQLKTGEWLTAEQLRPGDWLAMPRLTEDTDDLKEMEFDGPTFDNGHAHTPDPIIEVTDDFLFTLGYFAGDGFASTTAGKGRFVSVAGNPGKKLSALDRCSAWARSVGLNEHETVRGGGIERRFYSGSWAFWFQERFGHDARSKRLPAFLLSLNQRQSSVVLDGLSQSDGYNRRAGRAVEYATTSPALAAAVFRLACRSGHRPSVRHLHGSNEGHFVISYGSAKGSGKSAGRVRSLTLRHPHKPGGVLERVYDITVDEDETVIVGGVVAHNCHRLGSEIHEAIHVVDVVAPDTIEEWQIHRIHEKLVRLEEIRRDGLDLQQTEGDDIRYG